MAAYGALVSLMNDLELIPNHAIHSFPFDNKQIASLSQTVHFLINFMDNYDSQVLESRIASAAHAAHDVIESHVVDQIHAGTTLDGKSRSYFLLDLQKAIDNMDFVKRKAKTGLKQKLDAPTYSAPASSEPLSSEKNAMVGFDAVVVRLLGMLRGEPSCQRVIPIVGMGGTGKTTLARNVFDHSFIQHHFDVRLWATISQKYSAENILKQLLSKDSTCTSTYCELGERLHKRLWRRRYLIVLDDMWSVVGWDEIQMFLPDSQNGSCVVVTTRLSNLAAHLSSFPFEMDLLDDDQSWELFCGKTFGEEDCPIEFEEIGKKIVKRCRGLPLSIVVIGGHLKRSSRTIEYWEMFGNLLYPLSSLRADEQCLKVISLSYEHLPACLKPCFLYLGIFKEDAWIDASKLLGLWIVEGFVKGKKGASLEEVAEGYLTDLIDRNLILVRERKWNGKVVFFGIHDIVRELCLKVAEQEKFFGVLDTTNVIGRGRERRIVVPRGLSSLQPNPIGALQLPYLLRSLICQEMRFIDELLDELRLLRLCACFDGKFVMKSDKLFPAPNFHRVNLRYLVNGGNLPSSVSLFWNIQTLIIQNDICVPYEIWEMTQLRHVGFRRARLLPDPIPSVMNEQSDQQKCIVLENLHTLSQVRNLRLTEEVCKRMPNVKNLELCYIDRRGDCKVSSSDYCPQNLSRLTKLESLSCYFDDDDDDDFKWRDVVQHFVIPTSLEELSLHSCHWEGLTKMMKSLPRLGCLHLLDIRGPKWDLVEEELQFPCLKILKIRIRGDLIDWNANSSHFPILEILHILEADKLSEIPFDIGEIPTLRIIHLHNCSVSIAVSAMRIVVKQESLGNEDLLLHVDFWEMEQVKRFQTLVKEECLMTNNLHLCCRFENIKAF